MQQKRRASKQQDTQQHPKRIESVICAKHKGVLGCDMHLEMRYKIKKEGVN
jgi:hypothetical protein